MHSLITIGGPLSSPYQPLQNALANLTRLQNVPVPMLVGRCLKIQITIAQSISDIATLTSAQPLLGLRIYMMSCPGQALSSLQQWTDSIRITISLRTRSAERIPVSLQAR